MINIQNIINRSIIPPGKTGINHSIVTARNLGIESSKREQIHVMIEDFLLSTLNLHGLNKSDVMNLALERYFISEGFLTPEKLIFLKNVSELDKKILSEGLFNV